jgi:hypothetical protein
VLLIFFIVHGFVVNSAVLLCGFKQTKGKRYENPNNPCGPAAGISGGVCVNHLWPVVAGGGVMKDEAFLEWYKNAHWGNEDLKECCRRSWNAAIKQALAAPVQEPVAWMYPDDHKRMLTSETFCTVYSVEVGSATRGKSTVPLYTAPPAQPAVPDAITRAAAEIGKAMP